MGTSFTKIFVFLTSIAACLLLVITSCNKKNDPGSTRFKCISCGGAGTCVNDTCRCVTGFEGITCETQTRSKFESSWDVDDKMGIYKVNIQPSTGVTNLVINNFHIGTDSVQVSAYVSADSLYIPVQYIEGKKIVGIGTISGSRDLGTEIITMHYAVTDTTTHVTIGMGYYSSSYSPSVWHPTQFGLL